MREAMAEVKRVSGKMQLDTDEGGVVRASYEMEVASKAVGSFPGEIGVTNGPTLSWGIRRRPAASPARSASSSLSRGTRRRRPGQAW